MYQTVNLHDFRKAFQEIRPNNFSYEGLETLFTYLTDRETNDSSYNCELDVIAFCCDFTECTLDDFIKSYGLDVKVYAKGEVKKEAIKDHIEYYGFWFDFVNDGMSIVYENF